MHNLIILLTAVNIMKILNRYNNQVIFTFSGESLYGADLRGAYLLNASMRDMDLTHAWLHEVTLRGADLRNASLHSATLRGADLSGADMHEASLRCADLSNARLCGMDLSSTDLYGADMRCAELINVTLTSEGLLHVQLSGASMRGAVIDGEIIKHNPLQITGLHWPVLITDNYMRIGCQRHSHDEWAAFDDYTISRMADHALTFWHVWKTHLLSLCAGHRQQ